MPRRPPGLEDSGPAFKLEALPKLGDHDEYHPPPKSAADALPVSRITDRIFIGSVKDLSNLEKLRELGITHILNVAKEVEMITSPEISTNNSNINPLAEVAGGGAENPNPNTIAGNLIESQDAATVLTSQNQQPSSATSSTASNIVPSPSNPRQTQFTNAPNRTVVAGAHQTNNDDDSSSAANPDLNDIVGGEGAGSSSSQQINKTSSSSSSASPHQLDQTDVSLDSSMNSTDADASSPSGSSMGNRKTSIILPEAEGRKFVMKHIPLRDGVNKNTLEVIDEAVNYVTDSIANDDKAVIMVHCRRGISRSAAVVVAYLMEKKKMTYDKALELVKSQRAVVSLNLEFRMNLSSRCEALNGTDYSEDAAKK